MLILSPVQQVNNRSTPETVRQLLSDLNEPSTYCLIVSGDTFGGQHRVMQLLDPFHPILNYQDEDETILLFASSPEEAADMHHTVSRLLGSLPWTYRFGLWCRTRSLARHRS